MRPHHKLGCFAAACPACRGGTRNGAAHRLMTELPLVFVGGLLGSSHCVGMCGPLALVLGVTEERVVSNVRRQLVFSAGRTFTYGFGGALAAYAGWWLGQRPISFVNVQS